MMRSSKPRRQGMTLVEVLIAGAVFGVFSTMICRALVVAFSAQKASEAKVQAVRQGSLLLDHLRRELAVGRVLVNPDPSVPSPNPPSAPYEFQPTQGDPLIFYRNVKDTTGSGGDNNIEVWYWYDPVQREVRHWEEGDPPTGTLEASNVRDFRISHDPIDSNLRIKVWVANIHDPLTIVGRMINK